MNFISGKLYGGIEAGGTKFVCAVAGNPDDIKASDISGIGCRYP